MTVSCAFLQHHKKYPSFNLSETYEWMDGKMEERALLDQMYFFFDETHGKAFARHFDFSISNNGKINKTTNRKRLKKVHSHVQNSR